MNRTTTSLSFVLVSLAMISSAQAGMFGTLNVDGTDYNYITPHFHTDGTSNADGTVSAIYGALTVTLDTATGTDGYADLLSDKNTVADGLWRYRDSWGALPPQIDAVLNPRMTPVAADPLTMTVSGLPVDSYDVYVMFLHSGHESQAIQAAISGNTLTSYNHTSAGVIATDIVVEADPWPLYLMPLGRVTGMDIAIDVAGVTDWNNGYFAGIAYVAVPEPATLLLMGMGGVMMLRRRQSAA